MLRHMTHAAKFRLCSNMYSARLAAVHAGSVILVLDDVSGLRYLEGSIRDSDPDLARNE